MNTSILILLIATVVSFAMAEDQDQPLKYISHKMFLQSNNHSLIIPILGYTNLDKAWIYETATGFNVIKSIDQGIIINENLNKSAFLFTNKSLDSVFLNQTNQTLINHTLLASFNLSNLFIIELPEQYASNLNIQDKEGINNKTTIFISSRDTEYLTIFLGNFTVSNQNTTNSIQDTILTSFYQVAKFNCQVMNGHKALLVMLAFAYTAIGAIFTINSLWYVSNDSMCLNRIFIFLTILKLLFCSLNYSYWDDCPWENKESLSILKSISLLLATLYQTIFCASFMSMAMGYRIFKQSLSPHELKIILIFATIQYVVASLFSLGSSFASFSIFINILINTYSLFIILFLLREAKTNFYLLNFRMNVILQTRNLGYLRYAIVKRKKLVSAITLTLVTYYMFELFFHFAWDRIFSSSGGSMKNYILSATLHETVDFLTVFSLLSIILISERNQQVINEGIIDIGNLDFREDIQRARNAIVYQCQLTNYIDFEEEYDQKEEFKDNLIIIFNPTQGDNNHHPECQIAYLNNEPQTEHQTENTENALESTIVSERNILIN